LDALDNLDTEDWRIIKKYQKLWIGKCDGCHIEFKLEVCFNGAGQPKTLSS
jgi:hypothetical protein